MLSRLLLAAIVAASLAFDSAPVARAQVQGQGVGQTGSVTANNAACWSAPGVIKDCGGVPAITPVPLSSLATQAANTIVANATGGSAAPTAVTPGTLGPILCKPDVQYFTTGTAATYTTATCNGVLPSTIQVEMRGGGGGGGGGGTTPGAATAGTASTWSGSSLSAGGGALGTTGTNTQAAGGTTANCTVSRTGAAGGPSTNVTTAGGTAGGGGGGGSATPANTANGGAAAANSGGGGGGGSAGSGAQSGGGGGEGGYCWHLLSSSIASSYTYTVGAAGGAGSAGTGGSSGGAGAAGNIQVIARWQ